VKLCVLQTDQGEFTSAEFAEYCPQQNRVVERRNGTMVATTRSLLKVKKLPGWFWGVSSE
jgi:hypothetical protein